MHKPDPNRERYGSQVIVFADDNPPRSAIDQLDYVLTQMARSLYDAIQAGHPGRSPILNGDYGIRIEIMPLVESKVPD